MNRKIKFRGLTTNDGFVYGDLHFDVPHETVYYKDYSQRICWKVGPVYHNQPVKNGTVGQYTGLKDKNGKEIYEGDVLGGIFNIPIQWCDKCKSLQLVDGLNGCYACEGDIHWYEVVEREKELEVVGNIYENPNYLDEPDWEVNND